MVKRNRYRYALTTDLSQLHCEYFIKKQELSFPPDDCYKFTGYTQSGIDSLRLMKRDFTFLQDAQQVHRRDRMPLHHFLRLIGGGRVIERDAAATNDELVSALKRRGIITQ